MGADRRRDETMTVGLSDLASGQADKLSMMKSLTPCASRLVRVEKSPRWVIQEDEMKMKGLLLGRLND
jgi:hypothetical protein